MRQKCPYCGSEFSGMPLCKEDKDYDTISYYLECYNCGFRTPFMNTPDEVEAQVNQMAILLGVVDILGKYVSSRVENVQRRHPELEE